jgi:hypothetical protein
MLVREQLGQRFAKLLNHDAGIVDAAMRAPECERNADGDLIKPPEMSVQDFNVAQDAMKSSRNAPVYLTEAMRRVETAQKIAANVGDDLPPIAKFVVHMVQPRAYDVIDVSPILDEG